MKPLFLIAGPSGCGKSTMAHTLEQLHGMKPVASYTTRPIREGEKEGVDHHYISEEEFDNLPPLVAFTEFNGFRYGVTADILEQSDIYVIDPAGIEYLKGQYKTDRRVVVIGILSTPSLCAERMKKRGDSEAMIAERLRHDEAAFANLPAICDIMLDGSLSPAKLADQAWAIMQGYDPDGVSYNQLESMFVSYVETDYETADSDYITSLLEQCGCTKSCAKRLGIDWIWEDTDE